MNNTGQALTTNDVEAIRKAQQKWRLQKRRELEAKARKKQFRLSTTAAAHSQHAFAQSSQPPSLSNPTAIIQPRTTAQATYAHHISSSLPPAPGTYHNAALYASTAPNTNPAVAASQDSVAQQIFRQKAIQQQAQLQQIHQAHQGVSSEQVRMHRLLRTAQEHGQVASVAPDALITSSSGVPIHQQVANQHPAARPVAPRPSMTTDFDMKNAVAAAAAAANAASANAVAMRSQFEEKAGGTKPTEEEAVAVAHSAANVSSADTHYAAMLPTSVSVAKSTQEAVNVAAAAAAAAASSAIPGLSIHEVSPLDEATQIKLEQLEAQRRWREEKRREISLKRAKGASSKRGRKRTKFLQNASPTQEHISNQSNVATAFAGMSPSLSVTNGLPGLGGSSTPFSTTGGSSVVSAGARPLSMSSGIQSHISTAQLNMQGGFLTGTQISMSQIAPSSTGMHTAPASVVGDPHLTAEDAAAMYAQMAGSGTGGTSLPMDTSGTGTLQVPATSGALADVDVVQTGEPEVGDPGMPNVHMQEANADGTGSEAPVEQAAEGVAQVDSVEDEVAKATKAATAEATGGCGNAGTETAQNTSMINLEHVATNEAGGIESAGPDGGNGVAEQTQEGEGAAADASHEIARRDGEQNTQQQGYPKKRTGSLQMDLPENVEGSEIVAVEMDIREKQMGGEETRDEASRIAETADRDHGDEVVTGETGANEEENAGRDADHETVEKEDDEVAADRFQEDGSEDIMTAAAWQSLDSINP